MPFSKIAWSQGVLRAFAPSRVRILSLSRAKGRCGSRIGRRLFSASLLATAFQLVFEGGVAVYVDSPSILRGPALVTLNVGSEGNACLACDSGIPRIGVAEAGPNNRFCRGSKWHPGPSWSRLQPSKLAL